jgi:integrase
MGEYLKTHYPGIFQYVGKNGTAYGIDYYAGGKKHREIIGPLLGEAQEKLAEKKALAKKGVIVSISQKRKITLREIKGKYEEIQKGEPYFEKTRKYYLKSILDFFGETKQLYRITPLDIEEFKKKRKETPTQWKRVRSDIAVNRELQTLRHMLNKAVEWGMLDLNPFDRFKKPILFEEVRGRVRYLTEEEIKSLLNVSPLYLKNIIKAALFTGLRKGDILTLKWSDVDLERSLLFFNEQKKKGKLGIKLLNSDMVNLLMTIPKGKNDYIFCGPDGEHLKDVKRSFHTALKKTGITDFHFHDLRHTSASHMIMRGASPKAVQKHLNHSSLAMTERYAHLSPDFQRSEVERLNGLCDEGIQGSKKLVRSEDLLRNGEQPESCATA